MAKLAPPHQVRQLVDGGMALPERREMTAALARYFHRLLVQRTPEANDEFVRVFHAIADRSMVRNRPAQPLMCGKGCSLCCRSQVAVLAPEAFALARAIRSKARHAELHERIRERAALYTRTTLTERRRAGSQCSFLVADICSAYAERPLTCRMLASFDLRACEISAAGGEDRIPQPNDYHLVRSLLAMAAYAAIGAAGLPVAAYELNASLATLLDAPDGEARWYAGDEPFARDASSSQLSADFLAAVDRVAKDAAF